MSDHLGGNGNRSIGAIIICMPAWNRSQNPVIGVIEKRNIITIQMPRPDAGKSGKNPIGFVPARRE